MPRMTVHMFGIMYFDLCSPRAGTVLLPNGTEGDEHLPPHYPSLFVELARYEGHENWPGTVLEHEVPILTARRDIVAVPVLEFRIDTFCDITFPADQSNQLDVGDLQQALLRMHDVDPNFSADLDNSEQGSIARVQVTSGKLQAFRFNRGVNAVQWTIKSGANPLRITAGAGSVTLKPAMHNCFGAEVVFTNAPDLLSGMVPGANLPAGGHGHGASGHGGGTGHTSDIHHFALFGKIDDNHGTPRFPSHRTNIQYRTAVMAALEDADIQSSCTPPCC